MDRLATLVFGLVLAVALSSCDTNVNKTNPNELTTENFFQDTQQALTGVFGVYDILQETGLYSRHQYFNLDMLAEEAVGTSSLQGALRPVETRTLGPSNGSIAPTWNALYLGIKRANLVMERIPENAANIENAERLLAEARFLRALYYFELVSLWGDVPLLESVKSEVGGEPRAPAADVYALILNDLDFAASNLPVKSAIASDMLGRAPRGAALALEGRVHLMQGNWEEARAAFQSVIDLNEYELVDNYFDNFMEETENNAESIFEVQFSSNSAGSNWGSPGSGDQTWRRQEYGWLDWNNVLISDRLLNEFEDGDPRKDESFYQICDTYNNGQNVVLPGTDQFPNDPEYACGVSDEVAAEQPKHPSRPSWRKYENYYKTASTSCCESGINMNVLRYAEVLVGLAEAQIELGNITAPGSGSPSAVSLLNQVRQRPSVNMPDISTVYDMTSTQGALEALYHEYASEFAGEQVLIYPQVRRLAFWEDWAGDEASNVNRFLPIPQSEIDSNPEITPADQNPGY